MTRLTPLVPPVIVFLLMLPSSDSAAAGFTETLKAGTFLIDASYVKAWIDSRWDENGDKAPLVDPIERYEPGGGKQGTIEAHPEAEYDIFVARLQYGILDNLTVGIGVPVAIRTFVDPVLGWTPGDYQPQLGRPYSEQDFWEWAADMGQSKPGTWTGNRGQLSDIILGARLRFSDWITAFDAAGFASSLSIYGAIPTGKPADPEEVAAAGTTMWDLSFQGQLSIHLSFDKTFKRELDDRLTLGLDVFYDVFFEQERTSPRGLKNPLLLNYAPYIGDTYTVDPGDFAGFSVRADVVPYRGPAWDTWITKGDMTMAHQLPPVFAFNVAYTFTHIQQSDWTSDYEPWDWDREKLWKPGYKNILLFGATFSFFRLGVPLQIYAAYRTSTLIPGKNTRAADAVSVGLRVPLKFW